MPVALVHDSETTGLPLYGAAHPADAPYQPRMCALAMALVDQESREVLDRASFLVQPDGWPVDDETFAKNMAGAEAIHGLSLDKLLAEGTPLVQVHEVWQDFYARSDYLCAFSWLFDFKVIRGECKRLGHPIPFRDKKGFCLMKASAMHLYNRQRVKAVVACKEILGREHTRAHTADGDLDVNIDLFRFFAERELVELEHQPEAKGGKSEQERLNV